MQNMDWKNKALTPNSCDPNPPSNNCNPSWDVNLRYISKDDLNSLYGYVPNPDEVANGIELTDLTEVAISYASEKVNIICGNKIEGIGFNNLNQTQQNLVKRATARMTIWYLKNGIAFLTSSVSSNVGGISTSITPPNEPDYVMNDVYGLLEQANLYQPVKSFTSNFCSEKYNNSTVNWGNGIYDQGDIQYVTWNQANRTFLRPSGVISSDNSISHQDVSDTQAKVDLISNGGGSDHQIKIETNNVFVPNPNKQYTLASGIDLDIQGIETQTENRFLINAHEPDLNNYYNKTEVNNLVNGKQDKQDSALQTTDKTIVGAINELGVEISALETQIQGIIGFDNQTSHDHWNSIGASTNVSSTGGLTATNTGTIPTDPLDYATKEYVDILSPDLYNYYTKAQDDANLLLKQDKLINQTNIKSVNNNSLLGSGNLTIDKTSIGLGNVDNTSDLNKPISTATQTALNGKQDELINGDATIVTDNKVNIAYDGIYLVTTPTDNLTVGTDAVGTQVNTVQNNYTLATTAQTIKGALSELNNLIPRWVSVGTSTNVRTWTYTLVVGKRYRVKYNWEGTTSHIGYKEVIFVWEGTNMELDNFLDSVSAVTVLGISVIGVINTCQLNATSTGITIITKEGTSSMGRIIGLQETTNLN